MLKEILNKNYIKASEMLSESMDSIAQAKLHELKKMYAAKKCIQESKKTYHALYVKDKKTDKWEHQEDFESADRAHKEGRKHYGKHGSDYQIKTVSAADKGNEIQESLLDRIDNIRKNIETGPKEKPETETLHPEITKALEDPVTHGFLAHQLADQKKGGVGYPQNDRIYAIAQRIAGMDLKEGSIKDLVIKDQDKSLNPEEKKKLDALKKVKRDTKEPKKEQLQELSRKLLGKYVKKGMADLTNRSNEREDELTSRSAKMREKARKKDTSGEINSYNKRFAGIMLATNKLSNSKPTKKKGTSNGREWTANSARVLATNEEKKPSKKEKAKVLVGQALGKLRMKKGPIRAYAKTAGIASWKKE